MEDTGERLFKFNKLLSTNILNKSNVNEIVHIKDIDQYKRIIKNLCIIKYTASWCKYCVLMKPLFDTLSQQYGDKITFVEVDIDISNISEYENIDTIPLIQFYDRGKRLEKYKVEGNNEKLLKYNLMKVIENSRK